MSVLLSRPYMGYAAGAVAWFDAPTEAALIAQGYGTASSAASTSGAQAPAVQRTGRATIAAAAASVVISHPECTPQSDVSATIIAAAADGTLTSIVRVVPAAGAFTVYGNAAATAAVEIGWKLTNIAGSDRH